MPLDSLLPTTRLKRRLLHDLVEENVALLEGTSPARRSRPRPLRDLSRLLLVVLAAAGLFRSSDLLAGRQDALVSALDRGDGLASAPATARLAPRPIGGHPIPVGAGGYADFRRDGAVMSSPPAAKTVDPTVFPLAVRRIAIDAGHGGSSTGARSAEGQLEKELTLDIARRVERALAAAELETLMTRDADRNVPLRERARLANAAGADLFLSIHLNWLEDSDARGVETYYAGISEDAAVNRLALVENSQDGHAFGELRLLLERLYTQVRQEESQAFAAAVQRTLWSSLAPADPLLVDRGVKAAPFTVLISTDMPSVLAEVSCLSNEEEARRLADPGYRQAIADALASGVRSYAASVSASAARKATTTAEKATAAAGEAALAAAAAAATARQPATTQKGT
jgi:N-acetylmuramoyl-L-alanine amidase